jgi:hypothetical protein
LASPVQHNAFSLFGRRLKNLASGLTEAIHIYEAEKHEVSKIKHRRGAKLLNTVSDQQQVTQVYMLVQRFAFERRMGSKESSLFGSLHSLTRCLASGSGWAIDIRDADPAQTLIGTLVGTRIADQSPVLKYETVHNPILSPQHILL